MINAEPPKPPADLRIDGTTVGTARAYIGPCGSPLLAVRVDACEPQHADALAAWLTAASAWMRERRRSQKPPTKDPTP